MDSTMPTGDMTVKDDDNRLLSIVHDLTIQQQWTARAGSLLKKYRALPKKFNWYLQASDVLFYLLRPELAPKNPFYLFVGMIFYRVWKSTQKSYVGVLHYTVAKANKRRRICINTFIFHLMKKI
ncbi:hypothetical protein E2I00_003839 [Balaenoptera physalus]|uniref:Uncharacterized protein n=1 Tax=Balaenoptera physalus TaxID=9770 RepID=A0A643BKY9_BALPH|nr:hypothetical protein E2I00_003839 [Balaenoptera physalus]